MTEKRTIDRSLELYRRARELVPGGTQLISRRPQIFAPGVAPIYASRARGSRIWDVDGGEYLDYGMSVSACILGYADEAVNRAVSGQLDDGVMYSLNHPAELELAERLCHQIPCAEMVRFAKGGGEACAVAVRIARGTTGRDKVLFCGYHGWHDWYLAANLAAADSLDDHLLPDIEPVGVPKALAGTALPFAYGDLTSLKRRLNENAGETACVIMEPMRSMRPPAGYLEDVKRLAREHGAVLIFDEVTTGFRHAVGGVEEFLGVVPDMAVLAKSLSNGFAMGAVVGRRDVMAPAARMFISSTNWSDLVGIRAALATLQEIERRTVPQILADHGRRLQAGFNRLAADTNVPVQMAGLPQTPIIEFDTTDGQDASTKRAALFAQEMAKSGVLFNTHPIHSAAHTDDDLDWTLDAARNALKTVRDSMAAGDVDRRLEVSLEPPIFRRLVT